MNDKTEINKQLTVIREARGYTMKSVAEGIGMKPDSYRNYETGRLQPSVETISKLADFYGVTTDYLLGRPDAQLPDPYKTIAAQSDMKAKEQAALKKWLALDAKKREAVLQIMVDIVHEYENYSGPDIQVTQQTAEQLITVQHAARDGDGIGTGTITRGQAAAIANIPDTPEDL